MTWFRSPPEISHGSPATDPDGRAFEQPQHHVTITKPFEIGRFEVTQAKWEAVMKQSSFSFANRTQAIGAQFGKWAC
ncbi:SUMF1/EgtB/PvdO family nonheme iron enzyme [Pararhizobium sp. PWRC1-1]|uniref:SUMF1/EgtB/PvdO family nonheme iron enzyme n=1 Tax=Pararhizobium sp. PWRC1-1 TaxID=2804566 RepID=UPI003CF8DEC8